MNRRLFRLYREPVCSCEERGWRRGVAFAAVVFLAVLAVRDCGLATAKGEEDGRIVLYWVQEIDFSGTSTVYGLRSGARDDSESTGMVGLASWYGAPYHGRRTACGETYDENALTAAHRTMACGTVVRVCRTDAPACVVVTINDRGPFVPGRVVDLSRAAMARLRGIGEGVIPVTVEEEK
ncbi:MAG: septal ring lytic transglycosylase RlpA family protein [Patescibacteria group bacterium]